MLMKWSVVVYICLQHLKQLADCSDTVQLPVFSYLLMLLSCKQLDLNDNELSIVQVGVESSWLRADIIFVNLWDSCYEWTSG